ncbi:hypothetical protein ABB37_04036 [Leptomonas pyrrhocoris]|uniref:WW domain-containing protein n=1 Tax=Leptomonas pyrrhocoris TaxID=157538 RepID=A0A0M9G3X9_LEPPY|nr:hypothetical protein ABB37_04036 [Leptomonas pyrrhocoris]KPA81747.1 hypothetical protein ABB37_04036 [Leptomonas pyrrhocoris]|eukprot:XP_015660186.1 hypothetical protein ABB37_04036 [Leptomonas pyrrhocoris]
MSASVSSSSTSKRSEEHSYPSSSSATEATHSSSASSSDDASADGSEQRASSSSSSSSASSAASSRSSPSREGDSSGDDDGGDDGAAPLKLPRLEEVDKTLHHSTSGPTTNGPLLPAAGGSSIFPAPPVPSPSLSKPAGLPPRYGPVFPPPPEAPHFSAWAPPPPPPLPTLSASAKDLTEVDVRAGVRLGVFWAPTRLNKEQIMDEIESVRMTSSVERVLLESAVRSELPGVPVEEREYAWATVFFAEAEAAELCVARLCQPGRRSKWSRVCIQRLPLSSLAALPLSPPEEQRYRVHAYQLESVADTPGAAAATTSAVTDTVLARTAGGWCVLSTGGLFPTVGLATYLKHRRSGDFSRVEVCPAYHPDPEQDTCGAGGQCSRLHLREVEQWKLLLPVVLPAKAPVRTSPHMKPASVGPNPVTAAVPAAATLDETPWQKARHDDCLVVKPLPADIDERAFVYMFRGCKGFLRAQTVRTVDAMRYGVVQFEKSANAKEARQQAIATTALPVRFYGEVDDNAAAQLRNAVANNDTAICTGVLPPAAAEAATSASAPTADSDADRNNNVRNDNDACATPANTVVSNNGAAAGATNAPGVPFPPLPEGWEYGLSRRTMQYFFLQSGKKSTTWKHPVTQEPYKAQR